jgi:hypothetical protein
MRAVLNSTAIRQAFGNPIGSLAAPEPVAP